MMKDMLEPGMHVGIMLLDLLLPSGISISALRIDFSRGLPPAWSKMRRRSWLHVHSSSWAARAAQCSCLHTYESAAI